MEKQLKISDHLLYIVLFARHFIPMVLEGSMCRNLSKSRTSSRMIFLKKDLFILEQVGTDGEGGGNRLPAEHGAQLQSLVS